MYVVHYVCTYEYDDPLFLKLLAPVPSSELCNFIVSINGDVWPKWVVFNLEELFYENATNLYIVLNFTYKAQSNALIDMYTKNFNW